MWLLRGAGMTLVIALIGTIVGFGIGLVIGVIRTIPLSKAEKRNSFRKSALRAANFLLSCYIEVFRGTPMIVQAVVIYYGLMEMYGIDMTPFSAGLLVVSINTGAYMAEIVRGGIESIDKGQTEAAHAIGMTHAQTMINVILPQAIRNILPATSNEFVINIKDTSVLNVISVSELFFTAKSIKGAIFRSYEAYLVVCAIYFILTFSVTRALRFIEKRMDGPEGYTIHGSSTMPDSSLKIKVPGKIKN
jgi:putative lysine transport system permease protein